MCRTIITLGLIPIEIICRDVYSKCTHCKLIWIKPSAKMQTCKCNYKSFITSNLKENTQFFKKSIPRQRNANEGVGEP